MTVANAFTDPRAKVKSPPTMRRRCYCGCNQVAKFIGTAGGVAMMHGCELSVARWVKNPVKHRVAEIRAAQRGIAQGERSDE